MEQQLTLAQVKQEAFRLFCAGDFINALLHYELLLRAAPLDLDARMKVADLLLRIGEKASAGKIYRALADFSARAGHPLRTIVALKALEAAGEDVENLYELLERLYAKGSSFLASRAARLA